MNKGLYKLVAQVIQYTNHKTAA